MKSFRIDGEKLRHKKKLAYKREKKFINREKLMNQIQLFLAIFIFSGCGEWKEEEKYFFSSQIVSLSTTAAKAVSPVLFNRYCEIVEFHRVFVSLQ